jgi:hypothetical protein
MLELDWIHVCSCDVRRRLHKQSAQQRLRLAVHAALQRRPREARHQQLDACAQPAGSRRALLCVAVSEGVLHG